jgi:hypothetical protein
VIHLRALNLLGLPLSRPADLLPTRVGNFRGYWPFSSCCDKGPLSHLLVACDAAPRL